MLQEIIIEVGQEYVGRVDVLKKALREGLIDKVVLEEEHHVNGKEREGKHSKQGTAKHQGSLALFHQEGCYSKRKNEVIGHWFPGKEFGETYDMVDRRHWW